MEFAARFQVGDQWTEWSSPIARRWVASPPGVSGLSITNESGALGVTWQAITEPPVDSYDVEVFRGRYKVKTETVEASPSPEVLLDGLTMGERYRVAVRAVVNATPAEWEKYGTCDCLLGPWVEATGVPRIPTVLLMQIPRVVESNEKFPVTLNLEDKAGRPVKQQPVTLFFESGRNAAAQTRPKRLAKVKTNLRGIAATKVKIPRTGRLVAKFKAAGRNEGTIKSQTIRVRG